MKAGWRRVALADICEVRKGTNITEKESEPGDVPVVAGGVRHTYTHSTPNREAGVVTVSASGANAGFVNYWDRPIFASDCSTVEPGGLKQTDGRFLYHRLKSLEPWIQDSLRRGAAQPHVYAKDLAAIEILLPPIEEQRRIVAVLDAAEALCARRRQAIAKLDILAQAIFIDMFGDPVRAASGPRVPIGGVACVVTGNTPPRSDPGNYGGAIEWLKSDNILKSGRIDRATEMLSAGGRRRGRVAPAGASLVVCIAGSPQSIGRVGLLDRQAAFNQQINAVIPGDGLLPEFLFHQLKAGQRLVQKASTNSMKGMVSKSALCGVELLIPPISTQAKFVHAVDAAIPVAVASQLSLERLDKLFASLQQRAFRGVL